MSTHHPAAATSGPRRVAVVGSGVSGLVAAWVLARDCHVTLYEADDRLGGHADTHDVEVGERTVSVDTGFIVHNERTYPTLLRLFDELGVATQESDMSMSVRDEETGLEWAGALGAAGLFPTRANLRNARYLRMLTEIPRFHRMAKAVLAAPDDSTGETLSVFLERGRFTDFFVTYFMTPLVSAVWSTDPDHALEYPARYLFRFLDHHGMLTVFGSPTWRTVTGGSREYVERVAKRIDEVLLSAPVSRVHEHAEGVDVTSPSGTSTYDAVVVATHPEQALALLDQEDGRPSPLHREVLGAIHYEPNVAQLHTDERLLPRAEGARASWNYQRRATGPRPSDSRVLVTYDMTRLQRLGSDKLDQRGVAPRFLVSLGAQDVVDPAQVLATMHYAHPIYNPDSVAAQARLPELNTRRVAFAGAYHGWGFHEDGALSGRRAAEHLGAVWTQPAPEQKVETGPAVEQGALAPGVETPARTGPAVEQGTLTRTGPAVEQGTLTRTGPAVEQGALARTGPAVEQGALAPGVETPARTPRLYATTIKHARTAPLRNVFSYSSYTWLVDLDDLPQFHGVLAPVLRRLASFEPRDHVGRPDRSLRENIDAVLAQHGIEAGGRVQMLAHARTLGYVFNPISVFWCHRPDNSLAAVVVEVHNTYGGRHAYVVHPDQRGLARIAKQLYVSPFNDTVGEYHVAVPLPGDALTVAVTLHRDGKPPFTATMTGTAGPADARSILRAALRLPVVPLLGMARIRLQGVKLWLRGLSVQPRTQGASR